MTTKIRMTFWASMVAAAALLGGAVGWAQPWRASWVKVQSPHFTVISDGGEGAARQVAGQMEQMRAVFHQMFPGLEVDPVAPLEILAVRNDGEIRTIEPAAYLGRRGLDLAGYFQRGPDRNLILLDLETHQDPVPYRTVYHEFTHLMLSQEGEAMPVWLDEGLAQLYENIQIEGKEAEIGLAEQDRLRLLQGSQLFPVSTLFTVDHTSPYYHEQGKGTLFYAESWALTHYLVLRQRKDQSHVIENYLALLRQHVDPIAAATQAFGNLETLQSQLQSYVRQQVYPYERIHLTAAKIDEKTFTASPLTEAEADATRADYMANNGRYGDATTLLQAAMNEDANNAHAHAVMGYIQYAQGNQTAAETWFGQAVALDPNNFLTQYEFGTASTGKNSAELSAAAAAKVEVSLRTAIRLNPRFAPAYDRLAMLYAGRQEQLDQARQLELQATQLDPSSFAYRLNAADILLEKGNAADAIPEIQGAMALASSPEEVAAGKSSLQQAEQIEQEAKQH